MASPSGEVPSHRACQHCRSQKVRCLPDESHPDVCQRCAKSGRPCIFTPLQKRKQRKRTDTRVAELEREMRAMRAALKHKENSTRSSSPAGDSPRTQPVGLWYKGGAPDAPRVASVSDWEIGDRDSPAPNLPDNHFTARPTSVPSPWQPQQRLLENPHTPAKDVIDSGLVTMATARQLLDSYRNDLFPHFPIVPISPSMTAEELRMKHPALFLAILAAGAGKDNPDLSAALDLEVLQTYANRTMLHSEKSLEMVQALLISSVWYNPPGKFGQLKYYEYIHMATTMAMDIGIGTRPALHRSKYANRSSPTAGIVRSVEETNALAISADAAISSLDTTNLVSRRTFLACYIICAGVSVSLRRPHMLRVTSYLRECVDVLDRSPNATTTDRTILAWTRLMMIAEEISSAFCYDDPGGIASITELRSQFMLRDFENRLTIWHNSIPEPELGTGSLLIMYYTMRLYLHEIALHVDHSPEDFRAPYQLGYIYSYPDEDEIPSKILAAAIAECMTCSLSLLNTFIDMEPHGLRGLPVFSYVRVSFAAFVLAKLCLSAAHPGSRIGKVLDRGSLRVESVLDRTILHVRNVIGSHPCRVPAIFLALLFKLRHWCLNPEIVDGSEEIVISGQKQVGEDTVPNVMAATKSIDGSNGVHTVSSQGSSPAQGSTSVTPMSQPDRAMSYEAYAPQGFRNNVTNGVGFTSVTTSAPMAGNYAYTTDNMEMDGQLYQMLNGMNAFAEGGLTGLDDWGPMATDFSGMGQMDASSWQQFQPNMNYNPRTI